MCIRDRVGAARACRRRSALRTTGSARPAARGRRHLTEPAAVSYTHLRAHETVLDLVCRLLLEKKKQTTLYTTYEDTQNKTTYHTP